MAAYLPFLPAERRIAAHLAPPDTPFAVTEKLRGALRIAALSPVAAGLGLTRGMALADARARVPGLPAFVHAPEEDQALLNGLAESCERYTPMVALAGDAALLLDLTGCFDALGLTERGIMQDLEKRLARKGFQASLRLAATPDAALALAKFATASVEALPVAALCLDKDVHDALNRAGLRTIGDLTDRPRAPLAARFGTALPVQLARLLEEDARITPRRAPPPIWVEQRFAEPMATVAPALDMIEKLAERAGAILDERGMGGRRFDIALFRTDGHVARLGVNAGKPLRAPEAIRRLFAERLDSLADPLDPGFGYDMIRLSVPLIESLEAKQQALDQAEAARDLTPLLDRLMVRFGTQSVRRFRAMDAHLPEYSATLVPPDAPRQPWPSPVPGEPPLRPLFLYDPPQRVSVIAEVPDGPPRRFVWRGNPYRVVRHEGPERIAYPWWKHPEGRGRTRDYYRVEAESGHRFWLFRHGLYGREKADPAWYLHGLFA
nr:DUF6504 family protein [Stakelama sediminis]